MWSRLRLLVLLLSLFACSGKSGKVPEGILEEAAMVDLMVDVHLVEGARSGVTIMGDSLSLDAYYRTVLIKHGLDSVSYRENFEYYSARPEKLEGIFEQVVERLSVLESELRP
jgi:hypothetical protein